jgi:hypothetical protein
VHEHPQVGGGEQLPGEVAVALDDRVDVRGVEQRSPAGTSSRDSRRSPPGPGVGAGRPRQAGQDALVGEEGRSAVEQTSTGARVVGRSTPGVVTLAPTMLLTRVDFPARSTRRRRQQGGVEVAQARQEVVVDLVDDRAGVAPGGVTARGGQTQRGAGDLVAQHLQGVREPGGRRSGGDGHGVRPAPAAGRLPRGAEQPAHLTREPVGCAAAVLSGLREEQPGGAQLLVGRCAGEQSRAGSAAAPTAAAAAARWATASRSSRSTRLGVRRSTVRPTSTSA